MRRDWRHIILLYRNTFTSIFKDLYPRPQINSLQSFRARTALTKTLTTAVSDITKTVGDKKEFFDFFLPSP